METLVRKIAEHAREIPDQTAVIFKKDELTYRELYTRICCAGKLFREMGIRRGDRVMYTSQSKTETVYVHLGIQYAGAAAVPYGHARDRVGAPVAFRGVICSSPS